jgi:hypothetical protein
MGSAQDCACFLISTIYEQIVFGAGTSDFHLNDATLCNSVSGFCMLPSPADGMVERFTVIAERPAAAASLRLFTFLAEKLCLFLCLF